MDRSNFKIKQLSSKQVKSLENILYILEKGDIDSKLLAGSIFKELFPKNARVETEISRWFGLDLPLTSEVNLHSYVTAGGFRFLAGIGFFFDVIITLLKRKYYYIPKEKILNGKEIFKKIRKRNNK